MASLVWNVKLLSYLIQTIYHIQRQYYCESDRETLTKPINVGCCLASLTIDQTTMVYRELPLLVIVHNLSFPLPIFFSAWLFDKLWGDYSLVSLCCLYCARSWSLPSPINTTFTRAGCWVGWAENMLTLGWGGGIDYGGTYTCIYGEPLWNTFGKLRNVIHWLTKHCIGGVVRVERDRFV